MFRWLFSPQTKNVDLDQLKNERFETSFGFMQKKRFVDEQDQGYSSFVAHSSMRLSIVKSNLFAWTINPWFRYTDLFIEADLAFDSSNGASAVGLVFRYMNDENYYFCLVSRSGLFRFDVVFNGTPIPLITWLTIPHDTKQVFNLQTIVRGQHFSFYLNKEWIAETSDDHLLAGRVGWGAQNFGDKAQATFYLKRYVIESRPVEVESQYARWTKLVEADSTQRRLLAKTFFSFGKFIEARLQMLKAIKEKCTQDDLFFLAQCSLQQGLYHEAFQLVQQILEKDPSWELALREKAHLFYLQNRFLELRDHLRFLLERFQDDELLWNLMGHALSNLGHFDEALQAYEKAALLGPSPFFSMNAALTAERLKNTTKALDWYWHAGTLFFRQERFDDVMHILIRLDGLGAQEEASTLALRGKLFFKQGDYPQAKFFLKKAVQQQSRDSSVHYLYGLLLKEDGNAQEAVQSFRQAIALEPDCFLYHFKLAEVLYYLKDSSFEEFLQKALAIEPSHPWLLNFRGLIAQNAKEKTFYLEKARLSAPKEQDIVLNLSAHYHQIGRHKEAFDLLLDLEDSATVFNHRGNLYSRENRFQEALNEYEKALLLEPDHPDMIENTISCAIALKMYSRAEELLLKLIDIQLNADAYASLAHLLRLKGDFVRAEVTLRRALEIEPAHVIAQVELGYLYLAWQKYLAVDNILHQLEPVLKGQTQNPQTQAACKLQAVYRRMAMQEISCATCGRTWWVPLAIPSQGAITVHGEIPDEAPAGCSPVTHKIFCVGCAQKHMQDGRFLCPDSGVFLQFKDDRLKYLIQTLLPSS